MISIHKYLCSLHAGHVEDIIRAVSRHCLHVPINGEGGYVLHRYLTLEVLG
jgi:hypothetical protein